MKIDNFKDDWQEAGNAMNPERSINRSDIRRATSLDRLAGRYRHFSAVGMVCGACMPLMLWLSGRHGAFEFPLWFIVIMALYFFMASIMDYWLYIGVKGIDVERMNVETVLQKTMFFRKRHFQFMALLIPMALAIVLTMMILLQFDTSLIFAMVLGFLFGAAIGIREFLRFMADYRQIIS